VQIYADNLSVSSWWLRQLELFDSEMPVSTTTRDLMGEIKSLRKYGVKPSLFQDGMLHASDQAWVLNNPSDFRFDRAYNVIPAETEALILLADRSSVRSLKPEEVRQNLHGTPSPAYRMNLRATVRITLDGEGELYCIGSNNLLSVRDVFEDRGAGREYELLRLSQVLRLYDLVVPIKTVSRLPGLPQQPEGLVGRVKSLFTNPEDELLDLVLPRVKRVENRPEELQNELKQEVEKAAEETEKRRAKREHEVVGHIRQLPDDHSPSQEARERAREELGVELSDNETYVRRHSRGEGDPVKGHEAKRR